VIEIPHTRLKADTLQAVIEEFILREGTDYGAHEISLDDKRAQVRHQLDKGEVLITFDPRTENCTLMTREQFKRGKQNDVKQHGDGSGNNLDAYEDYSQDIVQNEYVKDPNESNAQD
jgi:uncharacterized protein YheU (UPF0270 family)